MSDDDLERIDHLVDLAGDHLPEDWEIRIEIQRGMIGLTLLDPDGNRVEPRENRDAELPEMMLTRINAARAADGLGPIGLMGESDPYWRDTYGYDEGIVP